tara:strand:- start:1503 stop:1724 length:222 start_codon:yes stop_codon:yes gene_type:complete
MDLSLGGKTATDKDISYLASDLSSDPVLGGKMKRKAKVMRSVPQIYVKYAHLGGFADLYGMQQSSKLEKLLRD